MTLILEEEKGRVDGQMEVLDSDQLSQSALIEITNVIISQMGKAYFNTPSMVVFKHIFEDR